MDPYRAVIQAGDLEALKTLLPLTELACPTTETNRCLVALAAEHGQLPIVQWLRQNGCFWDHLTPCWAAQNNHWDVLQWCHANGCPWNYYTSLAAAANGHLALLQWLTQQGCPWLETAICEVAAANNHWHVLHWVLQIIRPPHNLETLVHVDPRFQFFLARQWLMVHHGICPKDRDIHKAWLRTVEATLTHDLEPLLCRDVVGLVRQYC